MKRQAFLAFAALAVTGCSGKKDQELTIPVEPVQRRDIVVQAEATGVVEPINVIEVKGKSSGQIVQMPVETGTFVKPGDLLVQLDTRDTRNAYAQARADLDAAQIRLQVARRSRDRAQQLFRERIITSEEYEAAQVEYANAQATVLRNRAALDLRAQSLEEATIRAPVAGTIIEKAVAIGQVIASGTGGFSGGTTIVKLADLTKVRVRTLVNETDIGKLTPGLPATVVVDAYPDRPFMGSVEKIEPQARVEQSVTMFPVLVSIDNTQRLLMPGMNGEVSIEVDRRENVIAISNDAIRNMNDIAAVAPMLGLDPDSIRQMLRQPGPGARMVASNANGNGSTNGQPETARSSDAGMRGGGQRVAQRGFNMPQVTDQQCEAVTATLAGRPDIGQKMSALRERMRSGELDRAAMQQEMQKIYAGSGVDPDVARACNFRDRGDGAGADGAARGGVRDARPPGASPGAASRGAANRGAAEQTGRFGPAGGPAGRGRRAVAFVVQDGKYIPRVVQLGISNYDYAEVLSGIQEGEQVAILNVAAMQARQRQELEDIQRRRVGMPGLQRQQQGGAGQGGAGQGGAGGGPGAGTRARPGGSQ